MKIHELKTIESYFWDVYNNEKQFEVRKNDRDFKVGDVLHLRLYYPKRNEYLDHNILCEVIYILDNTDYVKEGYIIMGIEVLSRG